MTAVWYDSGMAKQQDSKDASALELGKKLQSFYDSGYVDRKQALTFALLRGMAYGFGFFLGSTILIGLLIALLSQFTHIPLANKITNALTQSQTQSQQ